MNITGIRLKIRGSITQRATRADRIPLAISGKQMAELGLHYMNDDGAHCFLWHDGQSRLKGIPNFNWDWDFDVQLHASENHVVAIMSADMPAILEAVVDYFPVLSPSNTSPGFRQKLTGVWKLWQMVALWPAVRLGRE